MLSAHNLREKNKAALRRAEYVRNPQLCACCNGPIVLKDWHKVSEMLKRKFCSSSCSAKTSNRIPKRDRKPNANCRLCNIEIPRGKTVCTICIFINRYSRNVEHRTKAVLSHSQIREHSRRILKDREKKCEKCGYERFVEVCHRRPVRDFPDTATLWEINAPENLAILCPNCHWEFDHGMLQLEAFRSVSLPSIATQA